MVNLNSKRDRQKINNVRIKDEHNRVVKDGLVCIGIWISLEVIVFY